ncbi:hypothetical protein DEM27_01875 [Metarhizobium album]|uniref:Lipoprotein n=1 Tax=Metarhizobium album TaxID=2182425 RepID=A0A2U2DXB4_9HYPH|nr:hypothetical protein [Rhizobium album]PWE57963.1 hypothetical protein DEM27_01875 [Rhizobium album]
MKITHEFRVAAGMVALVGACLSLSSCMSSPTYGTDKTAAEQLITDLGDATALTTKKDRNLKYSPRPGLVLPGESNKLALVEPQESLAGKNNPQWVESPEETRKRLVDDAELNKNKPHYRSPLALTGANARSLNTDEQLATYRAARAEQKSAYSDRRYLSDPPTEYRAVSDQAALDDLGEPERKKEKRRKKEAAAEKQSSRWWMPFQ